MTPLADARDATFSCVRFSGRESAVDYLRTFVTDADGMMVFRRVAAEENQTLYRLSDHEVLESIATRIAQHSLCLILPVPIESRALAEAAPVEAPPPQAMTPSQHAPAPVAAEPVEIDFADLLDQSTQAATLVLAAQAGVPFCEMCEKQRAAAAAGAV